MRQLSNFFANPPEDPQRYEMTRTIVIAAARNPNPVGQFFRDTADIRQISDDTAFLEALRERHYECIVAFEDGVFAGLLGYQVHDGTKEPAGWHLFAWETLPKFRGRDIATDLMAEFIRQLWFHGAVKRGYLSAGDLASALSAEEKEKVERLVQKAVDNELPLMPCIIREGERFGEIVLHKKDAGSAHAA